ncbi:MAG: hypothetical protein EOP14_00020 [Pseudomonas sp.]|nr:MAG: hypothetical protein EOP14_00020 [Pseudomonas sp.]
MTLSLPIVVGKKYVRRDGEVITANKYAHAKFSKEFAQINIGSEPEDDSYAVYLRDGRVWQAEETDVDLVSDYIEPARGHPHAALMMEFAKDAAETDEPWRLWQFFFEDEDEWTDLDECPYWEPEVQFRRKPTINPDPHAETLPSMPRTWRSVIRPGKDGNGNAQTGHLPDGAHLSRTLRG